MQDTRIYYRLQPIGVDLTSSKDIEKYNEKLVGLSDIEGRLQQLRYAYLNKEKQRRDLAVTLVLEQKVAELSVFHNIKYNLFKKLKKQCFSLCLTLTDDNALYFLETDDFEFVKDTFVNFVNQTLPNTSQWERVTI